MVLERKYVPDVKQPRFSGLRLASRDPRERAAELKQAAMKLLPLTATMQRAFAEPFCIDDSFRGGDPLNFWCSVLQSGEVFPCYDTYTGDLLGLQALMKVLPGRSAYWLVYALPDKRGTKRIIQAAHELISYAFQPFPQGLGLLKVKAEIAYENQSTIRLMEKLGAEMVGILRNDGLFHGMLCDMVLLEIYNPAKLAPQGEPINVIGTGTELQPVHELGGGRDGSEPHEPVCEPAAVSAGGLREHISADTKSTIGKRPNAKRGKRRGAATR